MALLSGGSGPELVGFSSAALPAKNTFVHFDHLDEDDFFWNMSRGPPTKTAPPILVGKCGDAGRSMMMEQPKGFANYSPSANEEPMPFLMPIRQRLDSLRTAGGSDDEEDPVPMPSMSPARCKPAFNLRTIPLSQTGASYARADTHSAHPAFFSTQVQSSTMCADAPRLSMPVVLPQHAPARPHHTMDVNPGHAATIMGGCRDSRLPPPPRSPIVSPQDPPRQPGMPLQLHRMHWSRSALSPGAVLDRHPSESVAYGKPEPAFDSASFRSDLFRRSTPVQNRQHIMERDQGGKGARAQPNHHQRSLRPVGPAGPSHPGQPIYPQPVSLPNVPETRHDQRGFEPAPSSQGSAQQPSIRGVGVQLPLMKALVLEQNWESVEADKVEAHRKGLCRPCSYFWYKLDKCRNGDNCQFCHLCDKGESKRRKKEKNQNLNRRQIKASHMQKL